MFQPVLAALALSVGTPSLGTVSSRGPAAAHSAPPRGAAAVFKVFSDTRKETHSVSVSGRGNPEITCRAFPALCPAPPDPAHSAPPPGQPQPAPARPRSDTWRLLQAPRAGRPRYRPRSQTYTHPDKRTQANIPKQTHTNKHTETNTPKQT